MYKPGRVGWEVGGVGNWLFLLFINYGVPFGFDGDRVCIQCGDTYIWILVVVENVCRVLRGGVARYRVVN